MHIVSRILLSVSAIINRISARLFPVVKYLQRTRVFFFFPCNLFHGKQNRRAYGHRNCINFIINWPILALFPPYGIIDVRSNEHRSWFRCNSFCIKTELFDNFFFFPREFCFGNFAVKYSISILVRRWSIRRREFIFRRDYYSVWFVAGKSAGVNWFE